MNLEARKKNIPTPKPYRNQGGAAQPIDKGRQGGSGHAGADHIGSQSLLKMFMLKQETLPFNSKVDLSRHARTAKR
jgi:hypothetical protein